MKKLSITSERILKLMKKNGYDKNVDFANDLSKKYINSKYNPTRISRWLNTEENDVQYNFQLFELIDIAKFFNCSIDYLIGLTDDETINSSIEINSVIGLSEKSIDYLKYLNSCVYPFAKRYLTAINQILESDEYVGFFLDLLEQYLNNDFNNQYYNLISNEKMDELLNSKKKKNMYSYYSLQLIGNQVDKAYKTLLADSLENIKYKQLINNVSNHWI